MKIENSVVLVTGASRGIGRSLVSALVEAGAKRVYAAARKPEMLKDLVSAHPDRVVAVQLDVTNASDIAALAQKTADVSLLINNAGSLTSYGIMDTPRETLEGELATNFYGMINVTKAMLPALEQTGGAVANVLTVVSLASMAGLGGYSASKAAAFSATQSLRADLKKKGISVHAVFPGPVDTDMAKDITLPKTSPADVARAILEGIARGDEDILPDPMARQVWEGWTKDPKAVERQFGAMG
jgi:NAD(P)-dependent dehydrogenase (short-subunit alcohol dehydrogenase family)